MNDVPLAPTSVPSVSSVVKNPTASISIPNLAYSASSEISALKSDSESLFFVFSCRLLTVVCSPPLTPIIPAHLPRASFAKGTSRTVSSIIPAHTRPPGEGAIPVSRSYHAHHAAFPLLSSRAEGPTFFLPFALRERRPCREGPWQPTQSNATNGTPTELT